MTVQSTASGLGQFDPIKHGSIFQRVLRGLHLARLPRYLLALLAITTLVACEQNTISIVNPEEGAVYLDDNSENGLPDQFQVSFSQSITGDAKYELNGIDVTAQFAASGDKSVAANSADLLDQLYPGDNLFRVSSKSAKDRLPVVFHYDIQGPVLTTDSVNEENGMITVSGVLTDPSGVATLVLPGVENSSWSECLTEQAFTYEIPVSSIPDGLVQFETTDCLGHTATHSFLRPGSTIAQAIAVQVKQQGINAGISFIERQLQDFIGRGKLEGVSNVIENVPLFGDVEVTLTEFGFSDVDVEVTMGESGQDFDPLQPVMDMTLNATMNFTLFNRWWNVFTLTNFFSIQIIDMHPKIEFNELDENGAPYFNIDLTYEYDENDFVVLTNGGDSPATAIINFFMSIISFDFILNINSDMEKIIQDILNDLFAQLGGSVASPISGGSVDTVVLEEQFNQIIDPTMPLDHQLPFRVEGAEGNENNFDWILNLSAVSLENSTITVTQPAPEVATINVQVDMQNLNVEGSVKNAGETYLPNPLDIPTASYSGTIALSQTIDAYGISVFNIDFTDSAIAITTAWNGWQGENPGGTVEADIERTIQDYLLTDIQEQLTDELLHAYSIFWFDFADFGFDPVEYTPDDNNPTIAFPLNIGVATSPYKANSAFTQSKLGSHWVENTDEKLPVLAEQDFQFAGLISVNFINQVLLTVFETGGFSTEIDLWNLDLLSEFSAVPYVEFAPVNNGVRLRVVAKDFTLQLSNDGGTPSRVTMDVSLPIQMNYDANNMLNLASTESPVFRIKETQGAMPKALVLDQLLNAGIGRILQLVLADINMNVAPIAIANNEFFVQLEAIDSIGNTNDTNVDSHLVVGASLIESYDDGLEETTDLIADPTVAACIREQANIVGWGTEFPADSDLEDIQERVGKIVKDSIRTQITNRMNTHSDLDALNAALTSVLPNIALPKTVQLTPGDATRTVTIQAFEYDSISATAKEIIKDGDIIDGETITVVDGAISNLRFTLEVQNAGVVYNTSSAYATEFTIDVNQFEDIGYLNYSYLTDIRYAKLADMPEHDCLAAP